MFYNCTNLTYITIPNSVTAIESSSFSGCNRLNSVYCQASVPPASNNYSFDNDTFVNATLYVPTDCKSAYESVKPWWSFRNIVEMDFDGVNDVEADAVSVNIQEGSIVISGATEDNFIEVFDSLGRSVYRGYETSIGGLASEIYMVKVAGTVVKVRI